MELVNVSKASVYFRHGCWNHRYAKVYDNGQREYGTITGFSTAKEATESFNKYLTEYREKVEQLKENAIKEQQDYYDEDIEEITDSEEDYDDGGIEDEE